MSKMGLSGSFGSRPSSRQLIHASSLLVVSALLAVPRGGWADAIDDLSPQQWYKVPNSNMQSVVPANSPGGATGPKAIMIAWSGGAYDTVRDRLIVWGGGHTDYAGNEIYVFDLNTLTWKRLTNPSSPNGGSESGGVYGDGSPRSNHTYNDLTFSSDTGKFYFMGEGSVWQSGVRSHHSGAFNFETNTWESISPKPSIGNSDANVTAYDSVGHKVWVQAGGDKRMMSYDPVADKWTTFAAWSASVGLVLYATAAISPADRQMVAVGAGQFFVWNLDNPSTVSTPAVNGPSAIVNAKAPGFAFDTATGRYVGWNGGATVYTLDPKTLKWTAVAPSPSNSVTPTSPPDAGTYGRFQYSPKRNVFVVVNDIAQDVYVYRLSSGSAKTPSPPTQLTAN